MIRVGRTVEVRLVARITRRRRIAIVVACVALRAAQRGMHASQRIVRILGVIKRDIRPVGGRVAGFARSRETGGRMIRVCRSSPIRLMTSEACRRQSCVIVVRMALRAGHSRMRPRQRKDRGVIEARRAPAARRMA